MILGIDLGTTNSLVACFRDGKTELIPNAFGHFLTPSAVSVDENDSILVGLAARERLGTHPERTAVAFKRWMGSERRIRLGSREFRPEELSALVLKSLKADAEAFLGEVVSEVVITVPAYFSDVQRKATKAAGELAGLRVERLLNEPTAAGLAYGLQERQNYTTFLVFDLGGGTFDVSVLEYFDQVVEVRASAGDTRLGGDDFVEVLIRQFLEKCPAFPAGNDRATISSVLWRAAEQAKRDLSEHESAVMKVVHKNIEYEANVTREEFESGSRELIERLRRPIERALMDARLQVGELAEIVLVGGATRMPMIRQLVARLFQRLPLRTINPDETIARGAAIQAALKARNADLGEVVLTDVMPYSLGIVAAERIGERLVADRFSPLIERNTPIPVSRMGTYSTVIDNQRQILIDIRQGESPVGSENLKLGELTAWVPPLPAGEAGVEVRFSYDANGILAVDARSRQSGKTVNTVIQQSANVMSPAEIEMALKRLEALKVHPRDRQENIYLTERCKRLYEDRLGDERAQIKHFLSVFESVLDSQDDRAIARAREELAKVLDQIDRGFVL